MPTLKALLDAGADPNVRATVEYKNIKNPLPLDVVTFSEYGGVAIRGEHIEVAILIAKAGGKAKKDETLEGVMRNQADGPGLNALRDILLRDNN